MKKITLFFFILCIATVQAQVPTVAAPTPPVRNASDVISIYGSAYTNIAGVNTNPDWTQTTVSTEVQIAGDNTLQYANFGYQGTVWATPQNISSMEYLHVDVWTNDQAPNVYAISSGAEIPHAITSVAGSWQSLNIPVAGLTGNLSSVIQFKFDGGTGGTIYLDNLYFWKTAVATGTDATLSDLKVDATTVTGFSSATTSYTVGVPFGSASIPQVTATTADPAATSVITQATTVPGNATVVVTSQNTNVTKTYTVSYVFTGPTSAAPTPPNRNASDVISLFSNAYSNITIDSWSAPWDLADIADMQVDGNDTKKVTFDAFLGVDFSGAGHHIDLTNMTRFHMDFWTDNTDLVGKVFNSKISQWGGTGAEVSAQELPINTGSTPAIETGKWVSIDVPMTDWTNNTTAKDDIAQFLITCNLGVVYIDNIYFYKGEALATNAFAKSSFRMYPNPAKDVLNLSSDSSIENITIYNTLGQIVSKQDSASNEASVNVSNLSKGVYVLTAQVGNELLRKQFIKE